MKKILILASFFLFGCSLFEGDVQTVNEKFINAKRNVESGKYSIAKEELIEIINSNYNPDLWLESKYLLGLCHYYLEEYDDAVNNLIVIINFFEKSNFSSLESEGREKKMFIESIFKLCKSKFKNIPSYQYDQSRTKFVIDDLQYYLENENISTNADIRSEIEMMIENLRTNLALKSISQAKLYLKLEKYEASMLIINDVINQYYDLEVSDKAKVVKVYIYLFQGNFEVAKNYRDKIKLINSDYFEVIDSLIGRNKDSLTLSEKIKFITS